MKSPNRSRYRLAGKLTVGLATLAVLDSSKAFAATSFLGVAAGDATTTEAVLWTRALDSSAPAALPLTVYVATDTNFTSGLLSFPAATDASKDYTAKVLATGLTPNTKYYYRFTDGTNNSIMGTFKTAPDANTAVAVKFGFSGDMDGLIRPYALASTLPAAQLDFYVNLGDVIYENASNVKGNIGLPYTNSPSVTLSGDSASKNGLPVGGTTFATQAQLKADYEKKYREQFLPVNLGGQNCLQDLYAAQGNYTAWDNHELGNRQYINGGAPAGGSVGGAFGTNMPTGRGVDARTYSLSPTNTGGSGNVDNVNDVNNSLTDFMNRSVGFQTLQQVFLSYQPMVERTISSPADPRSDGTKQLYTAQKWGKNAIYINTDTRSYRDLRLKTMDGSADDTTAPRANNPARTMLGATQLAWLKQTLLDAETAGVPWKFVSISDPIDQLGPIGGTLTGVTNGGNTGYVPVAADGGKSWIGGYRAERNALLKFIADKGIKNVVFLATDDHQNRVNELSYSPTGQTEDQASYVRVPHCLAIVDGPLGATGPDLITNHTFANNKLIADSLANAQIAAGLDPVGLDAGYPGLFNVMREGDSSADMLRQPVDFYSPDTFNYNTLEVSADGQALTVKTVGINSTAQNAASEYSASGPAREILSFSIDAAPEPAFVSCPGTIVVTNDPGQCSAKVALPLTVTGRPAPVVTCMVGGVEVASPFEFPKGTTAVHCTASNVLGVATCDYSVTVVDGEAPLVTCQPAPNASGKNTPGNKQTVANSSGFFQLLSQDNCDAAPQIFVADSASAFVAGPFLNGDVVKITTVGGAPSQKKMSGAVAAHLNLSGDPLLYAVDADGNASVPIAGCSAQ